MQYFTPSVALSGLTCRRHYFHFQPGQVYELLEEKPSYLVAAHPYAKDPVYIKLTPWIKARITITPMELDLATLFK